MRVSSTLARALDLVPLAIGQAAAYIQTRTPRTSVEQYLSEFQESNGKKIKLLERETGDLRRDGCASNSILHDIADLVRLHPVSATFCCGSLRSYELFRPTRDPRLGAEAW